MSGFGRIEFYVLGRMLAGVAAVLAVIASMIVWCSSSSCRTRWGVRTDVGPEDILGLTLMKSPSVIQILLPFVFLFGGIYAYVGMNRQSELVAMRASGVSAWRFILPSAFAAFILGALRRRAEPGGRGPGLALRDRPRPDDGQTISATCRRTSGCARATSAPRW